MSNYPRIVLSGGNQYPAIATAVPSQLPVYEVVDGQGNIVTNLGNGPADGAWINMAPFLNGFTAGASTPQYRKNSNGIVEFQGLIVCPGGQTNAWAIPVGYRPNIDPASQLFWDWLAGGTDLQNPGRAATAITTNLLVGHKSDGTAGSAGAIFNLSRIVWATV